MIRVNSEPEPDIAIVVSPYTGYLTHHPYPQDVYWLIEVSDRTLTKDLEEKSVTYARNEIPEYWVIALPHKKLWVFRQPQNESLPKPFGINNRDHKTRCLSRY